MMIFGDVSGERSGVTAWQPGSELAMRRVVRFAPVAMGASFDLVITADYPNRVAELRLLDAEGNQLAYRHTDFRAISVGHQRGLFDLRNYLRHYVSSDREAATIAEIGVCIAEDVLGAEIFGYLWQSESERTLRIQLPGAGEADNHLAAALARVPWEIARPGTQQGTLGDRNLQVRIVHTMLPSGSKPVGRDGDDSLRVLFVFAEARGSQPLDARRERRELLRLFEQKIYPHRRVVAHVLSHGVTRERLVQQIREHGGYHIVHWSGHGHLNLLELAKAGGAKDYLSGEELVDLFVDAGGLLPRFFFLSACHSGDILRVADWTDFLAVAGGGEPGTRSAQDRDRDLDLAEQPGYTGTAHALLRRGVPSVVAMRYAVGDTYARDLALEFYRRLLADSKPKTVAAALTMARKALQGNGAVNRALYIACDHATPVLYGAEQPDLAPARGRSPALDTRDPRLHRIAELTTAAHEHFVGRTWELADLGSDFIGAGEDTQVKPVAVIIGLGGMGKTALVAEALALWATRFEWVLLYQAKPNPLGFDATLRDIDLKLRGELGRYHEHVKQHPADAIHRDAGPEWTGPKRLERLMDNLIRALRDESILLVLDNFEANLKPQPEPTADDLAPVWACQDPAWERCLTRLAEELVESRSRVLITSRRPLAAMTNAANHAVPLGPLLPGEAALFLREHPGLHSMAFGTDAGQKGLALRVLNTSRFHPLLMDRLARLTADPALRSRLNDALQVLETTKNFAGLPDLFDTGHGDVRERDYLVDALTTSLDYLLRDAGPDARRLLWVVATANEPVALGLLRKVWSEESHERQQLRQLRSILDRLPELPPTTQETFQALPLELKAKLDGLPPEPPARPELAPLLRRLVAVGLVTEARTAPDDDNPDLACHELVRERIYIWMDQHPHDRGDWTEHAIRLAYAEWLVVAFEGLRHEDMATALQAGSRALIYCVQAGAHDRLGSFASAVVTSSQNPRSLEALLPHLQAAADSAPEGQARWSCLGYLADALTHAGRPDASLPFFEQAVGLARAVAEAGEENALQAWRGLAWLTGNWGNALLVIGELEASRQRHLESAEAKKIAGHPAISILGDELEVLRIDILQQGQAATALPEVETRLALVETWWQAHRAGQPVPEAPDAETLARVLIGALDIARHAHLALKDWELALHRTDAILTVEHALNRPAEDIAATRANRAVVLGRLRRFSEAQAELEACLELFQKKPAAKAAVLSALADLFDEQDDVPSAIEQERRALALHEKLPDPQARASSHHNLAIYLGRSATPSFLAEAARHRLADLLYSLVARQEQDLQTSLHNYAVFFRRSQAVGTAPVIPRITDLLADPVFHALQDWLRYRQIDVATLQVTVDQRIDAARQTALPASGTTRAVVPSVSVPKCRPLLPSS